MDLLTYVPGPVNENVLEAAGNAAQQCGYDQIEEVLLDYEIIDVRRVSAESVKDHYPEWLQPPCAFSPDEIVRVDWHTWAVSKSLDGRYEKGVIARSESIVVAISTLMAEEVFTYGLGPEYNWLEWHVGNFPAGPPTASAFKALGELINGDWCDDVREHAEEDTSYLDDIHPDLRAAVAEAIGNGDEQK